MTCGAYLTDWPQLVLNSYDKKYAGRASTYRSYGTKVR